MAARGCGDGRQTNGVYWELGLGKDGSPVEDFLLDPPVIVPEGITLPKRGQLWHEEKRKNADGSERSVWHLLDRVGMGRTPAGPGYWNVADFVEEVAALGLSRRLSAALDFSRLTRESRIVLVHDRAWIDNPAPLHDWHCPTCHKQADGGAAHEEQSFICCAGIWWEDVEGGDLVSPDGLAVTRKMPSFTYDARQRPDGYEPVYRQAFFASFPASQLVVVRGDQSEERVDRVSAAALPVYEVTE